MRADRATSRKIASRRREDRRPRRATGGPSSNTDPRRRPTIVGSGSSLVTLEHRTRSVVVPSPATRAPRSMSRCAMTSTSLMRGMLVNTHSSRVNKQAASNGSAAFLLPSTSTTPDSRRPPSISSIDIIKAVHHNGHEGHKEFPCGERLSLLEVAKINDLLTKLDAKAFLDRRATSIDETPNIASLRGCRR